MANSGFLHCVKAELSGRRLVFNLLWYGTSFRLFFSPSFSPFPPSSLPPNHVPPRPIFSCPFEAESMSFFFFFFFLSLQVLRSSSSPTDGTLRLPTLLSLLSTPSSSQFGSREEPGSFLPSMGSSFWFLVSTIALSAALNGEFS